MSRQINEPTWRTALYLLIAAAIVMMLIVVTGCDRQLKRENERLREELAKAQQYVPLTRDTIRDTVEVVSQQVIEVEKIKNVLTSEDKQLLKDIDIKVKELEALQKTGMVTKDTVYLHAADDSDNAPLVYHDAWADFLYQDKRLEYSVRDSLAVAIKREYKKRFLWWRWGVKGYKVKVVNFNPHSSIRYNNFVRSK